MSGRKLKAISTRPSQPLVEGRVEIAPLTPNTVALSATHIWTPPVSRVELLTRFGTRLQSYIRPACRASDEALGLDGFPRASFSISLAASRALGGDRVWKRRSDRFTITIAIRTLRK